MRKAAVTSGVRTTGRRKQIAVSRMGHMSESRVPRDELPGMRVVLSMRPLALVATSGSLLGMVGSPRRAAGASPPLRFTLRKRHGHDKR